MSRPAQGSRFPAFALLAVIIVGLAAPVPSLPDTTPLALFAAPLLDSLHVPLFALMAALVFRVTPSRKNRGRRAMGTLALTLATAFATEWFQTGIPGRALSPADLSANVSGALLGTALAALGPEARKQRFACAGALLLASAAGAAPLYLTWRALAGERERFPKIGIFERPAKPLFWTPQGDGCEAGVVSGALHVRAAPGGSWCGVHYRALGQDWSRYRSLAFDLENHRPPFQLGIRIDGGAHPRRLTSEIGIHPGRHRYVIDFASAQGHDPEILRQVSRLVLHAGERSDALEFRLDNVELLP